MKSTKLALKFISISLVTAILFTFNFSSFASAQTGYQPKSSVQNAEVQKALEDLEEINEIDIKNVKETSEQKEFVLVLDDEESLITYDKNERELYVDGELAITDIVFDEDEAQISTMSAKDYDIGRNDGSGYWINTNYKTGSFNVVTVTVAAVTSAISLILTKKPTSAAISGAVGAVLTSLIQIDQYTVLWTLWSYKDQKKKAYYKDSLLLFNYKGRVSTNRLATINHYWGFL